MAERINTTQPLIEHDGQSCLESFGFTERRAQLFDNKWQRDMPYTKMLVTEEYDIQKEFLVESPQSYGEPINGYQDADFMRRMKEDSRMRIASNEYKSEDRRNFGGTRYTSRQEKLR